MPDLLARFKRALSRSNSNDPNGLKAFPLAPSSDGVRRLFFHRDTIADKGVIRQIFHDEDYRLDRLRRAPALQEFYDRVVAENRVPLIIDAGANIGASAVYFNLQFGKSRVCCFEPAANNVAVLARNTAGLDVEVHHEAIGLTNGVVSLHDPQEGEWGYRTEADPNGLVRVRAMSDFVATQVQAGLVPFIVKIDIEGGEDDLFDAPNDWVDHFPLLIIELHDWLMPKKGTSRSFLKCVAARDRDFIHIGENVFSISNDLVG